jgi:prepilin-type N-terminal cleavage/methylation domain-containing protein
VPLEIKMKNEFKFRFPIFRFSESGFTVMELLVVISVMGILALMVIANMAGQRTNQKIKIAQNELVTNLRMLQSNALSSKPLPSGQQVQYYILKIDTSKPNEYKIQAMYDVAVSPNLADSVKTIKLPQGIRFASVTPIQITRPVAPVNPPNPSCALIVFKLPFSKILFSGSCDFDNFSNPSNDSYKNILNFVVNVPDSPGNNVSADSKMTIKLTDSGGSVIKYVSVCGLSGKITSNNICD